MKENSAMTLAEELPVTNRPRERLVEAGEQALSDVELLAILLRTGNKNYNVLRLSAYLLQHFSSLYELKSASLEELQHIHGIGQIKAIEIKAAIELGSRINNAQQIKFGQVNSSQEFGAVLIKEMGQLQQEYLLAIFLNTKNDVIKKEYLFKGGLNQSIAHPREIFKGAVKHSAARIILAHNHRETCS